MTDSEMQLDSARWQAAFAALRRQFPRATDGILFCVYKLQDANRIGVPELVEAARQHGVLVNANSVEAAQRLMHAAATTRKGTEVDAESENVLAELSMASDARTPAPYRPGVESVATKRKPRKKTRKKPKARRKSGKKTGYELCVAELEKNKSVDYASIKAKADRQGISLFPIVYGRAKAALGLVATKRGARKKKVSRKRRPGRPKTVTGRRPGRPRKAVGMGSLEDIAQQIGEMQRERDELRRALEKISDVLERALS